MKILLALLTAAFLMVSQESLAQTGAESGAELGAAAEGAVEADSIHAAFVKLVDRGEARALFGLPADTFWRRSGGLRVALRAEDVEGIAGSLNRVAAIFSEATGQGITVIDTGPPPLPGQDLTFASPEADLLIVIGPRPRLAEIAQAEEFNKGMLARFELGTWPFMFSFAEGSGRHGAVLLADDEPPRAREASFILATVWALGGVTLGPEMTGLISDDEVAGPSLTPLGEAVFALFFNEELETGMTIEDAVLRAKTLLAK